MNSPSTSGGDPWGKTIMRAVRWGLGGLAVIAVLWSGAWYGARTWLAHTVDTAMADLRGNGGPNVDCAERSVGGWPFELTLSCGGGLTVTFPDGGRLTAADAYGKGSLANLDALTFHMDGPASYLLPDGRKLDLSSSDLSARIGFAGGRVTRLAIDAADLTVTGQLPGGAEGRLVSGPAEVLLARQADKPEDADIAATVDGITVSAGDMAFAPLPVRLTLAATVVDVDTALAGPMALADWQATGGKLALHRLEADLGGTSLTLSGEGSVGPDGLIDAEGQLVGRNLNALSAAAAAGGKTLTPELAGLVVALMFMGSAADDGGRAIGLTVEDGLLKANGRDVARLARLF